MFCIKTISKKTNRLSNRKQENRENKKTCSENRNNFKKLKAMETENNAQETGNKRFEKTKRMKL